MYNHQYVYTRQDEHSIKKENIYIWHKLDKYLDVNSLNKMDVVFYSGLEKILAREDKITCIVWQAKGIKTLINQHFANSNLRERGRRVVKY